MTRSSVAAKHGCRVGVGGKERFDGELRDGDVERGAEGRHGAEEGEFSVTVTDAQGNDDVAGPGELDLGSGSSQG